MLNEKLKDQLLSIDRTIPALREKYEKEIQNMIEKTLNPWQKVAYTLSGILGLCFFIGFGITAVWVVRDLPVIITASFVVGSITGLIWAVMCYRLVRSGKINLQKDPNIMIGTIWVMVVFIMTVDLMIGMGMKDASQGGRMILSGLVFLVMGALFMIQRMIERTELSVKENLLRIELQVAELQEKIK